jgi:rRNA methylases
MSYLKSNDLFEQLNPKSIFEKLPHPIVIVDHLHSPENMGAMIRISDNIGASEMCFLGTEPGKSIGKVRHSSASSKDNIYWHFTEETDLRKIVPSDKVIVAIETSDQATNIYETELPENIAFILGSESHGLNEELLSQCDMTVYIPVPGTNCSLNVTHAAAVAFFEWQRQMLQKLVSK